jgi:hypothetical protein
MTRKQTGAHRMGGCEHAIQNEGHVFSLAKSQDG